MPRIPPKQLDVLVFAEDPGAANFLIPLPEVLFRKGISCCVLAAGSAKIFFQRAELHFHEVLPEWSPDEFLDLYEPRLLLAGTSQNTNSAGLLLFEEAKKRGIITVGAVDMMMNAAYRFRGETENPLHFAPDHLLVPDNATKQAFVECGFSREAICVCGHPHYDFVWKKHDMLRTEGKLRIRERIFPQAPPSKSIALFAADPSRGLQPDQFVCSEEYTLHGRGGSCLRTDIVIEEFLDEMAELSNKPYLVLRLHPRTQPDEFAAYLGAFDKVSREEPAIETLFAADYVFGLTSMLLVEAAIMGKPTFSIVPRDSERVWLPTIAAGLTVCASSRDELTCLLRTFLDDSTERTSHEIEQLISFGASSRAADFVQRVLCS